MAIIASVLTSGKDQTASHGSVATPSISPGANRLLLGLFFSNYASSTGLYTCAGNSLTWDSIASTRGVSNDYVLQAFRAMGASPSSGAVTFTLNSPDTSSMSYYAVLEVQNTDTSGSNGSGAIVQSKTGTSGLANPTVITPNSAMTAGNGAVAVFARRGTTALSTERSGWTELYDNNTAGNASFEIQWINTTDTQADATHGLGSGTGRQIFVEIKVVAGILIPIVRYHYAQQ